MTITDKLIRFVFFLVGVAMAGAPALGQTGGPYILKRTTIDAGGGISSGGPYVLSATIAQPDAGEMAGGPYELLGGSLPVGPSVGIPVADAGPDQALLELGATTTLDGSQSYDLEGDPITYWWTMIEMPVSSAAVLSDPTSAWPSFVADVYGDYVIELVVSDPWADSDPDTVTVSFDNVKPVADAGDNQAVMVGDTVNLDGSGSTDANFDVLTYSWSFESLPAGSLSELSDPTSVELSFLGDMPGTYVVKLVVNDGLLDSDEDSVSIKAISSHDALVRILFDLIDRINLLSEESLKNRNLKNALTNKINAVLGKIDEGAYDEALNKLRNDILEKTNGCAETDEPDRNDWLTTCEAQGSVYPLIMEAIEFLENLI